MLAPAAERGVGRPGSAVPSALGPAVVRVWEVAPRGGAAKGRPLLADVAFRLNQAICAKENDR